MPDVQFRSLFESILKLTVPRTKVKPVMDRESIIATSFLAIPVIIIALMMKLFVDGAGKDAVTAFFVLGLPILFPLLAGLASSLIMVDDSARRSTRYKQVIRRLEKYELLMKNIKTDSAVEKIVLETENILLGEIIEWVATAKNLGH